MEEKTNYLVHHGVKGMKWGVRRAPESSGTGRRSVKGNIHRGLAAVYGLNEKTYKKMGNNTLASMNASAKRQQISKAEKADAEKNAKRQQKLDKIKTKGEKKAAEQLRKAEAKKIRIAKVKKAAKKAGKASVKAAVLALSVNSAVNKSKREYERRERQYDREKAARLREAQDQERKAMMDAYMNNARARYIYQQADKNRSHYSDSFNPRRKLNSAPRGPY